MTLGLCICFLGISNIEVIDMKFMLGIAVFIALCITGLVIPVFVGFILLYGIYKIVFRFS
jgi:hypothetical protein